LSRNVKPTVKNTNGHENTSKIDIGAADMIRFDVLMSNGHINIQGGSKK